MNYFVGTVIKLLSGNRVKLMTETLKQYKPYPETVRFVSKIIADDGLNCRVGDIVATELTKTTSRFQVTRLLRKARVYYHECTGITYTFK